MLTPLQINFCYIICKLKWKQQNVCYLVGTYYFVKGMEEVFIVVASIILDGFVRKK